MPQWQTAKQQHRAHEHERDDASAKSVVGKTEAMCERGEEALGNSLSSSTSSSRQVKSSQVKLIKSCYSYSFPAIKPSCRAPAEMHPDRTPLACVSVCELTEYHWGFEEGRKDGWRKKLQPADTWNRRPGSPCTLVDVKFKLIIDVVHVFDVHVVRRSNEIENMIYYIYTICPDVSTFRRLHSVHFGVFVLISTANWYSYDNR